MISTGSDEKTMFEALGARSVQRSKIFSASSSEVEDTNNDTRSVNSEIRLPASTTRDDLYDDLDTRIDYGFEYEFIEPPKEQLPSLTPASTTLENAKPEKTDEDNQSYPSKQTEQTYEFLLFRKPASLSATHQTPSTPNQIVIRSPTPEPILGSRGPGSILKPRALSHYFTSHLPPSTLNRRQSEYTISALSPSQLQSLSSRPWPGTHLPWRTIYIPPSRLISQPQPHASSISTSTSPPPTSIPTPSPTTSRPRTKPSKRRRIHLRRQAEDRKISAEKSKLQDELEREKRARRNREKKVKKKAREKRKKEEEKGGEVESHSSATAAA